MGAVGRRRQSRRRTGGRRFVQAASAVSLRWVAQQPVSFHANTAMARTQSRMKRHTHHVWQPAGFARQRLRLLRRPAAAAWSKPWSAFGLIAGPLTSAEAPYSRESFPRGRHVRGLPLPSPAAESGSCARRQRVARAIGSRDSCHAASGRQAPQAGGRQRSCGSSAACWAAADAAAACRAGTGEDGRPAAAPGHCGAQSQRARLVREGRQAAGLAGLSAMNAAATPLPAPPPCGC